MQIASSSSQKLQWLTAVLLLSLLFIFYTTLYPFDFIAAVSPAWFEVLFSFNLTLLEEEHLRDIPRNIVLFIPFGFAVGGLLAHKWKHPGWILLLTLFIGSLFSFAVEVLQSYSLLRYPTITDVVFNGLGAAIGFLLYWFWGARLASWLLPIIYKIRPFVTVRNSIGLFLLYATLLVWLSILAQKQAQLSNWDTTYHLLLGNETTENRGWLGYMTNLFVMDRALTREEVASVLHGTSARQLGAEHLLAYYDFVDDDSNNFPPLLWQLSEDFVAAPKGIFLAPRQWLKSAAPATELSEALRDSAQFTLGTHFAVDRFDKGESRRIVSVSEGTGLRNLTLGQDKHDLVLRLRMPFTDLNGRFPELVIPNIFQDELYHHYVVTYDGAQVIFYIDDLSQQYRIELAPAFVFFNIFPPQELEQIQLTQLNLLIFSTLYDALFFVPLALLLAFIYGRLSWPKWRKGVFVIFLLIIFAFVWEGVLTFFLMGYTITVENVRLDVIVGLIALGFFALWRVVWSHLAKQA